MRSSGTLLGLLQRRSPPLARRSAQRPRRQTLPCHAPGSPGPGGPTRQSSTATAGSAPVVGRRAPLRSPAGLRPLNLAGWAVLRPTTSLAMAPRKSLTPSATVLRLMVTLLTKLTPLQPRPRPPRVLGYPRRPAPQRGLKTSLMRSVGPLRTSRRSRQPRLRALPSARRFLPTVPLCSGHFHPSLRRLLSFPQTHAATAGSQAACTPTLTLARPSPASAGPVATM